MISSYYGELDPNPEIRYQHAFQAYREHSVTTISPNTAVANQIIKFKIEKLDANCVMVPGTQMLTFDLNLTSKDKNQGIVNNIGRSLVAKKTLKLGNKSIEVIDNADILDTYMDLYLTKEDRKHRILQGIQSSDGLKARLGSTKADGSALGLSASETAIKKTYGKRFSIPLDFQFFKYPIYLEGLKEDLSVTIQYNSPNKVMLVTGDANATYTISDIALECDIITDNIYAQTISNIYNNPNPKYKFEIPYTFITHDKHEVLNKKDSTWPIEVITSAQNLQGILLLFKDSQATTNFSYKNKQFYNPTIKTVSISIGGHSNKLYSGGILPRHIFTEIKKYFYKEHSDIDEGEFLTTKFGLWVDFRTSQENALHGSGKDIDGRKIILQIYKAAETTQGNLDCHIFLFQDAKLEIREGMLKDIVK